MHGPWVVEGIREISGAPEKRKHQREVAQAPEALDVVYAN